MINKMKTWVLGLRGTGAQLQPYYADCIISDLKFVNWASAVAIFVSRVAPTAPNLQI